MATSPGEGRGDPVFPRLHHWGLAAALLLVITLTVPVMAGLI